MARFVWRSRRAHLVLAYLVAFVTLIASMFTADGVDGCNHYTEWPNKAYGVGFVAIVAVLVLSKRSRMQNGMLESPLVWWSASVVVLGSTGLLAFAWLLDAPIFYSSTAVDCS